jgi:hypothetical protein
MMTLFFVATFLLENNGDLKIKDSSPHKHRSSVITAKNTLPYSCPSTDPDQTGCSEAYAGLAATLTDANWLETDLTAAKSSATAALDLYVTKCNASRYKSGCPDVCNNKAITEKPANDYQTSCNPAPAVNTNQVNESGCNANPSPSNNESTCNTAYQNVLAAINITGDGPWVAANVQSSINGYIVACAKTVCNASCTSVVSQKNVANRYTKLFTAFVENCTPVASTSTTTTPPSQPPQGSDGTIPLKTNLIILLLLFGLIVSQSMEIF